MITTITAIGNSQGIRIPKLLLNESELGDTVELVVKKGEIKILPASKIKKKTVKDTLLLSEETLGADWNRPEEDEAWQNLQ
jgi:antitoxin component of MazEF toxin-antitoxin module